MKRMIFSGCIILVFASMVLVSYAAMTKQPITVKDLPDLKGKWTGSRVGGGGTRLNTDLEISNDSLPVQGKFIFYDVVRPGQRGRTEIKEFKNGKINDQGNLLFTGPNIEVELSLYKDDGKMKLEGNYFWAGVKATMSFTKK
jgi:hypothetical protein